MKTILGRVPAPELSADIPGRASAIQKTNTTMPPRSRRRNKCREKVIRPQLQKKIGDREENKISQSNSHDRTIFLLTSKATRCVLVEKVALRVSLETLGS